MSNLKVGVGTREYSFVFVVSDAQRLKNAGFDVFNAKKYQALFSDVMKQLDLITEFLQPQLEKYGVTIMQFCDDVSRDPETYEKVLEAFVAGLINFFRNLRQDAMVKVLEKAMNHTKMAEKARLEKLNDPRLDQVLQKEIDRVNGETDTLLDRLLSGAISLTALESSELNPGNGPTANSSEVQTPD